MEHLLRQYLYYQSIKFLAHRGIPDQLIHPVLDQTEWVGNEFKLSTQYAAYYWAGMGSLNVVRTELDS